MPIQIHSFQKIYFSSQHASVENCPFSLWKETQLLLVWDQIFDWTRGHPLQMLLWTENIMRISQLKFDKRPGKIINQHGFLFYFVVNERDRKSWPFSVEFSGFKELKPFWNPGCIARGLDFLISSVSFSNKKHWLSPFLFPQAGMDVT